MKTDVRLNGRFYTRMGNPCTNLKCHFVCFFDKLKYEIINKVLIFVSIPKLRYKAIKPVHEKICAPKVPFNFHFKIGVEKVIFVYFNYNSKLKIEKRYLFFNFQFSIYI